MSKEIGDILQLAASSDGDAFALATLVRVEGSSYRQAGARMLITAEHRIAGCLSGGCLEDEVIDRAGEVQRTSTPRTLEFDTRFRFGCDGRITIFVERVPRSLFQELAGHQAARRRCWATTSFGKQNFGTRLSTTKPRPAKNWFIQEIPPPVHFVTIGSGPEDGAFRAVARSLGWSVSCHEEISGSAIRWDEWTAALVKTHNYGRDFTALRTLLPLPIFYVGLLGSRRRKMRLLHELVDAGVAIPPHFFAPAGLDIGGESPEAVALAVVSEIHALLERRPANHLRDVAFPIHAGSGISHPGDSSVVTSVAGSCSFRQFSRMG